MTTGERIKVARKKAGLTQRELGEKIGVAYQTLAQWENNLRNPKRETLERIASALNVPTSELMTLTSDEERIAEIVAKKTGRSREEVRESLLEQKVENIPLEIFEEAVAASDRAVVEAFRDVTGEQLMGTILESCKLFNKRGLIEATLRVSELENESRFKK